jgi:CheY-like chemotaxis protein
VARILMIDDDPDIIEALRILLESAGHDFRAAQSGAEGLAKLGEVNPDLIILDVMMDTATEGFQLSLTLRGQGTDPEYAPYREVPILMLTSVHTTTPLRFAPDEDYLPVDAFLEKSAEPEEILSKVAELLASE